MKRLLYLVLCFTSYAQAQTWSPTVLNVPWASDYNTIASHIVNCKTNGSVSPNCVGNGSTDDTAAINSCISVAHGMSGGGTCYLPTGTYAVTTNSNASAGSPISLLGNVVFLGDGPTATVISDTDNDANVQTDYVGTWGGISFQNVSYTGFINIGLTFVNPSSSYPCASLWERGGSSGVQDFFLSDVDINFANCKPMWIAPYPAGWFTNLLVQNSAFTSVSTGTVGDSGVSWNNVNGIWSTGNTFNYNYSRLHVLNNENVIWSGNTSVRNANNQGQPTGYPESGGIEVTGSNQVQIINNSWTEENLLSTETGDSEEIMCQSGGYSSTWISDQGTITSFTSNTLTDTGALWSTNTAALVADSLADNGSAPLISVVMESGSAIGEVRNVSGINTSTHTLTLASNWSPSPSNGDLYGLIAWPIVGLTVQGNTIHGGGTAIQVYDGGYGITIQNNTIYNAGPIQVRAADENTPNAEWRHLHDVEINGNILNNVAYDTLGNSVNPTAMLTFLDTEVFASDHDQGMSQYNMQFGNNTFNPWPSNPSATWSSEFAQEGIFPCFVFGPSPSVPPVATIFQKVYFWNNSVTLPITYGSYFASYATSTACTTMSPPPSPNAPAPPGSVINILAKTW